MKSKMIKWASILTFVFIIVFYFAMNLMIPKWSDDVCYQYQYTQVFGQTEYSSPMGTQLNAPVESFFDAVSSNVIQYLKFNGRALVHTFVQFFCMYDSKIPYAVVACLLFGLMIYVLGSYVTYNKQSYFSYLLPLVVFTMMSGSKCMYDLIATGVNYVWSLSFCVLYLTMLSKDTDAKYKKWLLYILAILGGFSHEAISVAVSGGLVLLWFLERKDLPKSKLISMYIFLAGTILLFISPSNVVRFFGVSSVGDPIEMRLSFFRYILWPYLLIVSLILMALKEDFKKFVRENKYALVMLVTGSCFTLFVGAFNSRTVFFVDAMAGFLFFRSMYFMFSERRLVYIYPIIILLLVPLYSQLYKYQKEASLAIKDIVCQIENSDNDDVVVDVKTIEVPSYLDTHIYRLKPGEDGWYRSIYAWCYKKNSVTFRYVGD